MVETDVHYPTDTNLLWDALRKLIREVGRGCEKHGIAGWRQYRLNCRQVKRLFRHSQKIRYSTSKDEVKRAEKNQQFRTTYSAYLDAARSYVVKAKQTLPRVESQGDIVSGLLITGWIEDAERQIDQIERRVLQGEVIPHEEKVFSIFERHTEWISKGKAGVPVELGVRVCVLEDQYQFILQHQVMWHETDDKVAVLMVEQARQRYPELKQCSFDKGFYSPANQQLLANILEYVTLPKKGRWSAADKVRESSDTFRKARIQHPAIESCINNLEQRGLDRCRSHGRDGFERYVALSVVACNLHRIGLLLQRRERAKLERALRKRKKLAA